MHFSQIASLATGTENGISSKFYLQVFPDCLFPPMFKKKKSEGGIGIYYKQKQLSWSGFKFSYKIGAMIGFCVCVLRVCQMVGSKDLPSGNKITWHSKPGNPQVRFPLFINLCSSFPPPSLLLLKLLLRIYLIYCRRSLWFAAAVLSDVSHC